MGIADSVAKTLKEIAEKNLASVEVGFLEDATYDDGTPVAAVAFWNEYGSTRTVEGEDGKPESVEHAPPRPFFRRMIEKEKPTWGPKLAGAYKHTNGDGLKALAIVGDNIQGALIQSINDLTDPPLSPVTIKIKGFDKPLIDTSHMINSTGVRVVKGGS